MGEARKDASREEPCERDHHLVELDEYHLEEVMVPVRGGPATKAIRVTVEGRNLGALAPPRRVLVGARTLRFVRIGVDGCSCAGILLSEPKAGGFLEVRLGEAEIARHPEPIDPRSIRRLGAPAVAEPGR